MGIISWRSRFQVGTRFLKRGLDDWGNVANEVENEFFIMEKNPGDNSIKNVLSHVFYWGSIPLFWGHEKSKISPKPKIILDWAKDPFYLVSKQHFENLF